MRNTEAQHRCATEFYDSSTKAAPILLDPAQKMFAPKSAWLLGLRRCLVCLFVCLFVARSTSLLSLFLCLFVCFIVGM